jgi:translocation and assembly module TamB
VYGFRLGPGTLEAALAEGVAQVRPANLAVSEGNVRVAAQARLRPQPVELVVPPGPLVQNVRINPQMCAHALQYIAPVLSGVATAEGRFSIELDGCRIPLADPSAGEVAGRMIIHSAQIGPGPLVRELALALGYSSPAQLANQSTIDFRMVDGRVYHRGVVVQFPDLTVRTYGWVGLDKSLGLMAEMPVPPKWIGSNPTVAAALRNQTIQLPVGGTLDRPKVDQQVLRQVSRQFLEKAATNVIEDQLLRGLDRLLKPPQ